MRLSKNNVEYNNKYHTDQKFKEKRKKETRDASFKKSTDFVKSVNQTLLYAKMRKEVSVHETRSNVDINTTAGTSTCVENPGDIISTSNLAKIIAKFHETIKDGSTFVCTCCQQTWF